MQPSGYYILVHPALLDAPLDLFSLSLSYRRNRTAACSSRYSRRLDIHSLPLFGVCPFLIPPLSLPDAAVRQLYYIHYYVI
jgi:hypothetical protein